jgi:hypothetical protein
MKRKRSRKRSSPKRAYSGPAIKPAGVPERQSISGLVALPVLLAVVVYANTLQNEPLYDDLAKIKMLGGNLPSFSDAFLRSRGLTFASHVLDHHLWGSWIPGFRLTNVLLHTLATCLVTYSAFYALGMLAKEVAAVGLAPLLFLADVLLDPEAGSSGQALPRLPGLAGDDATRFPGGVRNLAGILVASDRLGPGADLARVRAARPGKVIEHEPSSHPEIE